MGFELDLLSIDGSSQSTGSSVLFKGHGRDKDEGIGLHGLRRGYFEARQGLKVVLKGWVGCFSINNFCGK